jgi:hypothetical protein
VLLLTALLVEPLAPFRPTVELGDREYRALDQGRAVVQDVSLPSRHIGVFAAIQVSVDGDRMARWLDDIAAFKRSGAIPEVGRFSEPPRIEDLAALTLDPADVKTLRGCTVDTCSMLFTPEELEQLTEPSGRDQQREEIDRVRALRTILLRRAENYLAAGRLGEPAPAFIEMRWPELAGALEAQPPRALPGTTSFLYWEKVRLRGKPIITIMHVTVLRESAAAGFDLLAVSRHVFSTRYISDGWNVLALLPPRAERPYFAYLYQARVDRLGGFFGALARRIVEGEIKGRASDTLVGLRNRLERGDPPRAETEGFR